MFVVEVAGDVADVVVVAGVGVEVEMMFVWPDFITVLLGRTPPPVSLVMVGRDDNDDDGGSRIAAVSAKSAKSASARRAVFILLLPSVVVDSAATVLSQFAATMSCRDNRVLLLHAWW